MKLTAAVICASALAMIPVPDARAADYLRGDSNNSGDVDISDAIHVLGFLFVGGSGPECRSAADANLSGGIDISDAVTILAFLYQGGVTLTPLSAEEPAACAEPYVVRSGMFDGIDVDDLRGVSGIAEQLSNRTIRLSDFYYDGEGGGVVYVWLHKGGDKRLGRPISPNIQIGYPGYQRATLTYSIPENITDDMFHSVCIWCDTFYLNFGNARLVSR